MSQIAFVTFKEAQALETALLLSVSVESSPYLRSAFRLFFGASMVLCWSWIRVPRRTLISGCNFDPDYVQDFDVKGFLHWQGATVVDQAVTIAPADESERLARSVETVSLDNAAETTVCLLK